MTARKPTYPQGEAGRVFDAATKRIAALPGVVRVILYGSYAKGTQTEASDIDLAVFFDSEEPCLKKEYRLLAEICRSAELDIQAQAFHAGELNEPCGILDEILAHGVDIPLDPD